MIVVVSRITRISLSRFRLLVYGMLRFMPIYGAEDLYRK